MSNTETLITNQKALSKETFGAGFDRWTAYKIKGNRYVVQNCPPADHGAKLVTRIMSEEAYKAFIVWTQKKAVFKYSWGRKCK